jgi:hypothetical protein
MDTHPNDESSHENWVEAVEYQQPRPETSFWKEVREYLENRDDSLPRQIPPVASCPICLEAELDIQGLPSSSGNTADIQPALVTICGHMACRDCLIDWYVACLERRQVVRCPVCMHELQFAADDCPHIMIGYLLPGNDGVRFSDDASYLENVPLTLPENGTQPERCNPCRRQLNMHNTILALLRGRLGTLETQLWETENTEILSQVRGSSSAWRQGRAAAHVDQRRGTQEDDERPGWGAPFPTTLVPVDTEDEIGVD